MKFILHEGLTDSTDPKDIIDALIADEEEAIAGYEEAISKISDYNCQEIFRHIIKEEQEHIEELNDLKYDLA